MFSAGAAGYRPVDFDRPRQANLAGDLSSFRFCRFNPAIIKISWKRRCLLEGVSAGTPDD